MTLQSFQGRSILIAEDNFDLAAYLRADLELAGASVVGPVGRVSEALESVASATHLDGAVLDINLHDERVYGVADALRAKNVPFVFVTGYTRESIPAAYADIPVCQKPVDTEKIADALFGRH